jgi:hypothetical protein
LQNQVDSFTTLLLLFFFLCNSFKKLIIDKFMKNLFLFRIEV